MEDYELFPDEEEEAIEEEGANRTFIILVGALGGLLAVGVCAFVVWAFFIAPGMRNGIELQNEATFATNTAIAAQAAAGGTVSPEASPDIADTPAPTDTPDPTETKVPTEAPEATPEGTIEGTTRATAAAAATGPTATRAAAEATVEPTATPKPTATRRPTPTSKSGDDNLPGTGVGVLGVSALTVGLLFLLVVVRRARRAV